ncbi:MAG: (deoxy)nucleoside triphosphate pyrophosphohydrolase [Candidatus Sericytochromatia bacterium]
MSKKYIKVVGAIIINQNNEILCALRSEKMSSAGFWEFPGGKIENGESVTESIIREIKEELNCDVLPEEKIFDDYTHEYPHIIVRLITVKCKIISGVPEPLEHEKLFWANKENILSLNWLEADIPTIKKLLNE